MSDENKGTNKTIDVAKRVTAIDCMGPSIKGLSARQLEALHVMKYETTSALHRLYMEIPREKAKPFIKRAVEEILDELSL